MINDDDAWMNYDDLSFIILRKFIHSDVLFIFLLIFSALSLFGSKPNLAPHANIRSKRDETDHNTTDQTPTEE